MSNEWDIALSLNMPGDNLDMVYTLCMLHVIVRTQLVVYTHAMPLCTCSSCVSQIPGEYFNWIFGTQSLYI